MAEKEFDVFVTVDRKLGAQQDLKKFRIPVILIRARTNRLEHIRPLAAELLERLSGAVAGELTIVGTRFGCSRNHFNDLMIQFAAGRIPRGGRFND